MRQVDLALSRSWRIADRVTLNFRVDAFNAFNTVNVGPPSGDLGVNEFGVPFMTAAEALGSGMLSQGGLTPLEQTGGPPSIQLGARLSWN